MSNKSFARGRLFKGEPVAGGIQDPGVVVGALHAGVESQGLAGQLPRGHGAGVGQRAEGLAVGIAGLLPLLEVPDGVDGDGVLHPLDGLHMVDKVDVVVLDDRLVDPLANGLDKVGIALKPSSVEAERKRSSVGGVMSVEIVLEEVQELLLAVNVGTRGDKGATGQGLVKSRIFPSVQLIDGQLPNLVRTRGTILLVTLTLMGHEVVHGVGPDGDPGEGGGDGGVVGEKLIGHHGELLVGADQEVGSPDANDGAVCDVGKPFDDQTGSGHLGQPVVVGAVGPVVFVGVVGDAEDADLVTETVQFLYGRVVGVLVRHEESSASLKPDVIKQLISN